MPSRTSVRAAASPKPPAGVIHEFPSRRRRNRITIWVIATAAVLCLIVLLGSEIWPFAEKPVLQDLAEASDSEVTIAHFHRAYFPFPGCVLDGVTFRHGPALRTLITIEKLTIRGSYLGILTRHVPRINAEGGHVFIAPLGSGETFHSQHSKIVVDKIVANGTVVDFASRELGQPPLRFNVSEALLQDVRWNSPINYRLKFHNPEPPGEVAVTGKFGGWTSGHPGDTPISGDYTFDRADLGVYGGIAGTLSSKGKFGGVLARVNVAGDTDTPDFEVRSSGHKVKLVTKFDAFVDATRGDTFLNHVDAHFGRSHVVVQGSVAGVQGRKGKVALLDLGSRQGRIEDVLGLFVKERPAPMSGPVTLRAKAEIPSGDEPFLEKVKLQGMFGIDEGSFSKPATQRNVDELSAGARGENKDNPETVLTDLKGSVVLERGIARFSDISFSIPGAAAQMHGTYNILNHRIDLHGKMRVDSQISKTASGVKALLLKVMDPFFKHKKKGEIVPVHISGTYEHPQFGLDLAPGTAGQNSK